MYKIVGIKPEEDIKKVKHMHNLSSDHPEGYRRVLRGKYRNTVNGNKTNPFVQHTDEFIRVYKIIRLNPNAQYQLLQLP